MPIKNYKFPIGKRRRKRKKKIVQRLPEAPPTILPTKDGTENSFNDFMKPMIEFEINGRKVKFDPDTPLNIVDKETYLKQHGDLRIKTLPKNKDDLQKALAKLPEPKFQQLPEDKKRLAPPMPNNYIRFIEKSAEELDTEIEYIVDEEDIVWLEIINELRSQQDLPPVTYDMMELLMDRLEKESYFLVQMNKDVDSSLGVIDDEAVCSICLDGECENSNVILFCDMCNLAVHQDCYGVPYIPEGQWLCRRCLHSPSSPVDCILCPNNGGAFKQTDRGHWAHIVCALWIPEVRFANTVFLEPIDSIDSIPSARWRLTCYICKQRSVGACIQCHKTSCYNAFHVTCAQQAGLYMKMETVDSEEAVLVQKIAYCIAHTPENAKSKQTTEETVDEKGSSSESPADKMKTARKVLAKKRLIVPVISVPTIPVEKIQEIASWINVPKKAAFMQRLIAYWTLKRLFRNGVPLLRRLITSHPAKRDEPRDKGDSEAATDITELYNKMKYFHTLRQDLERGRILCELIKKRERKKKELIKNHQEIVELSLAPFNAFLHKIVDIIKSKDTGRVFFEPVDTSVVLDYKDIISHPMDLQTMTEKINNFKYINLEALEKDFHLMISNCLTYNSEGTFYYKTALRLRDQGSVIFKEARKQMTEMQIDLSTGLFAGQGKLSEILLDKPVVESTPVAEEVHAKEIDQELSAISTQNNKIEDNDVLCKLLQLLEKCKMIRHKGAKLKRERLIRGQMANIKKKLYRLGLPYTPLHTPGYLPTTPSYTYNADTNNTTTPIHQQSTPLKRKTPVYTPLLDKTDNEEKDSGRESPVLTSIRKKESGKRTKEGSNTVRFSMFKKPILPTKEDSNPVAGSSGFKKPPVPSKSSISFPSTPTAASTSTRNVPEKKRKSHRPLSQYKSVISNLDSFKIYRSNRDDQTVECDEESDSEDSNSEECSSCSDESDSDDSSSSSGEINEGYNNSDNNDSDDNKNDTGEDDDQEKIDDSAVSATRDSDSTLEQLQLVWAKCTGFPWYPALIINPGMPKGYVHNGVQIPSPTKEVLALATTYKEPVYLVHFFDSKRTWQWLPRNKLEPLGVNEELDKMKLGEARKPSDRKAVNKAYRQALIHKVD